MFPTILLPDVFQKFVQLESRKLGEPGAKEGLLFTLHSLNSQNTLDTVGFNSNAVFMDLNIPRTKGKTQIALICENARVIIAMMKTTLHVS